MSNTMSERLKETLGMLETHGVDVKNVPSASDDEFVGSRGGEVIPFVPKNVPTTVPTDSDASDIRDDYVTSRNITHTLIDMAGSALEGALSVAVETQHPKAYSVFNELATTMRGLSKDLLEMQKIYKEITAEKEARAEAAKRAQNVTQNNVTNNTITTNASLADILKAVKDAELQQLEPTEIIDVN